MANIYELAQKLGAKNILKTPMAQNYLAQSERADQSQDLLQQAQTPVGAISAGIANYINQKRKGEALEQLNKEYEAQQAAQAEKRQALINTLPEEQRPLGNFLSDEDLSGYVAKSLTPKSEKDLLSIENQRLQNQKLQKDLSTGGLSDIDRLNMENKKLQNEKLQRELEGVGKPDFGKPPSGYRFTDTGELIAIPGGPATKQGAESAGKIALIKQGLGDISSFEKQIKDKEGNFDRSKIVGLRTYGRPGARDEYSKLYNALNARLRLESGAAVPESEVERAFETFAPSPLDSDATIESKITRLKEFFSSATEEIGQGRGAKPIDQNQSYGQSFPVNQSYGQDLKSKYGLE